MYASEMVVMDEEEKQRKELERKQRQQKALLIGRLFILFVFKGENANE